MMPGCYETGTSLMNWFHMWCNSPPERRHNLRKGSYLWLRKQPRAGFNDDLSTATVPADVDMNVLILKEKPGNFTTVPITMHTDEPFGED